MTNDLMIRQNMRLNFEEMTRAAKAMAQSGYFKDARDVSQAMVKVLAGQEMGLGPFASMSNIHIIQGKPVLGSNMIATLVKNDPRYDYCVKRCDNEVCSIEWFEYGEPVGTSAFTIDEAKKAGLAGKDNWKKYPSDMLFARAISRGARRFAPGIFGGAVAYTPDEVGADVDEDGYVIDGEIVNESAPDAAIAAAAEEGVDLTAHETNAPSENGDSEPTSNGIDWKAKAMGQKFPTFASCLVNAGVGYNSPDHVENALGIEGEEYNEDDTERLWNLLVARKQPA